MPGRLLLAYWHGKSYSLSSTRERQPGRRHKLNIISSYILSTSPTLIRCSAEVLLRAGLYTLHILCHIQIRLFMLLQIKYEPRPLLSGSSALYTKSVIHLKIHDRKLLFEAATYVFVCLSACLCVCVCILNFCPSFPKVRHNKIMLPRGHVTICSTVDSKLPPCVAKHATVCSTVDSKLPPLGG